MNKLQAAEELCRAAQRALGPHDSMHEKGAAQEELQEAIRQYRAAEPWILTKYPPGERPEPDTALKGRETQWIMKYPPGAWVIELTLADDTKIHLMAPDNSHAIETTLKHMRSVALMHGAKRWTVTNAPVLAQARTPEGKDPLEDAIPLQIWVRNSPQAAVRITTHANNTQAGKILAYLRYHLRYRQWERKLQRTGINRMRNSYWYLHRLEHKPDAGRSSTRVGQTLGQYHQVYG